MTETGTPILLITLPADVQANTRGVRALRLAAGDLYGARVTFEIGGPSLQLHGPWKDGPREVSAYLAPQLRAAFGRLILHGHPERDAAPLAD